MQILREPGGKYSSKRTMGVFNLLALLILFIYKEITNEPIVNMEIFISFLITATTLLGITIYKPNE